MAVAEEHQVGGTCVIRGCVPKKLLVYGAHFAEDLQDARRFGWDVPDCNFHWPTLRDNVLAEVARIEEAYTDTLRNHGVEIVKERATVTGPARGRRWPAAARSPREMILIATGAWPVVPDFPGSEHGITSNEAFHLPELPKTGGDRGRGLYRQRVRRHLPQSRQPRHPGQPDRRDPARL